jgi:hypothetical protein
MKKTLSRSYLYLFLFVIVAAITSLSLVRIINGFEGEFLSSTGELMESFGER